VAKKTLTVGVVAEVCKLANDTVIVTAEGRTLKLKGLGFPKSGKMKLYGPGDLTAQIPANPVDSNGDPLDDLLTVPNYSAQTGAWENSFNDFPCQSTPTVQNIVIWWRYENEYGLHLVTELVRIPIPACDDIPPC
jgi:hypothetical protein